MADPTPRLSHLLETSIYVSRLDRAQRFYQRMLGLELFLRDDRTSALGLPGNAVLLLFLAGGSTEPTPADGGTDIPPHDGGGRVHLCLGDSAQRAGRLGQASRRPGRGGQKPDHLAAQRNQPLFRDPDGSLVELATPGLWPSW